MLNRPSVAAALLAVLALFPTASVQAQGEIVITQAKANAGNVTPGDTAGFPVMLSLPGAYVLASNLQVPANKVGLLVNSHNVDIDMNGFSLFGADVANFGVVSAFGLGRIHDGVINDFRIDGILLTGNDNSNAWVVENMQIVENGDDGVDTLGTGYLRFLNNSILVNGGAGIICGAYCHIEGNTIADNVSFGVYLGSGTVLGNSIFSNDSFGIIDGTPSTIDVGYGNNTLAGNNGASPDVLGGFQLHPNSCNGAAC